MVCSHPLYVPISFTFLRTFSCIFAAVQLLAEVIRTSVQQSLLLSVLSAIMTDTGHYLLNVPLGHLAPATTI